MSVCGDLLAFTCVLMSVEWNKKWWEIYAHTLLVTILSISHVAIMKLSSYNDDDSGIVWNLFKP